jgi:hypothetical protein
LDTSSKEITISKEVLPELPIDYEETSIGDRGGANKQYRSGSTVHVREYDDSFAIHIDHEDPRRNPIRHLLKDSPETIAAVATSLYFAKRSVEKGQIANRKDPHFLGLGLFSFLASVLIFNQIFRLMKNFLFG